MSNSLKQLETRMNLNTYYLVPSVKGLDNYVNKVRQASAAVGKRIKCQTNAK